MFKIYVKKTKNLMNKIKEISKGYSMFMDRNTYR